MALVILPVSAPQHQFLAKFLENCSKFLEIPFGEIGNMDGELWRIWQAICLVYISVSSFAYVGKATSDPNEYLHYGPVFDDSKDVPGEPMNPTDFQNAMGVVVDSPPKSDGSADNRDPIEYAGLFEGDIILKNKKEEQDIERNAIVNERQKWRNGIVPYVISSDFSAQQRGVIAKAMMEYQKKTCISFKPRTTENDYIHIHRGNGCSSLVGRAGGAQPVSIGTGCEYTGIVVHELMHAVGFFHEQSRGDRDDYITIYFNNIQSGMEFNFQKFSWNTIQNLSVPYDLTSVMHYGPYAFSKYQGRPTILPKDPNKTIGQRSGFSPLDVEKINRLYRCGSGEKPTTTTPQPVTTKPPNSCKDFHRHCSYWSTRGECQRNPAWMKVNCKSSCNECNKPCDDLNKYCSSWARRGECGRNPDYMLTYCQKSCNSCPPAMETIRPTHRPSLTTTTTRAPSSSSCEDQERHCNYWAKKGECENNPRYMSKYCTKACNLC